MIRAIRQGDILESEAQTLVNTVNTVGVMGKGIALNFRKRFPDMYEDYLALCKAKEVRLGEPYLFRRLTPPWIVNFPTKDHWRSVSRLDAIVQGLQYLAAHISDWGVESMAVPPLGCGNGQLDWAVVGPTLFRHLDALGIPVDLYAPLDAPELQLTREFLATPEHAPIGGMTRLQAGWVALADIVGQLNEAKHAWPVGHTRWQKLAYFATASGIPTGLEFEERPYGPFSRDLARVLARLVNNGVLAEVNQGRLVQVIPGTAHTDAINRFREQLGPMQPDIRRTVDLMLRLDPERIEIAASTHFVAQTLASEQHTPPSANDVLHRTLHWKRRRRNPLTPSHVAITIRELEGLDWLPITTSDELPVGAPDSLFA